MIGKKGIDLLSYFWPFISHMHMSILLKDLYSPQFFETFSGILKGTLPAFKKKEFLQLLFDDAWNNRELKARMRHITQVLHVFMPANFEEVPQFLGTIIEKIRMSPLDSARLEFMFLPDYIEVYGIGHFAPSVRAIEKVTQFTSCEFAVRPFILKYGEPMIGQMTQWSLHEDHHVRRLASEGTRPRLPWAMALPFLKKDPAPVLPLLENLKTDPSEYVRRSVANHLNDISKDNPQITLDVAHRWKGIGPATDALIKHASRTLLKQGHPEILRYYGLHEQDDLNLGGFTILTPGVKNGQDLRFSFWVQHNGKKARNIRLEYSVYFLRQNGTHSKKVFKISEREIRPGEKLVVERKHSFRPITTRKYYKGVHKVAVVINGIGSDQKEFSLY